MSTLHSELKNAYVVRIELHISSVKQAGKIGQLSLEPPGSLNRVPVLLW